MQDQWQVTIHIYSMITIEECQDNAKTYFKLDNKGNSRQVKSTAITAEDGMHKAVNRQLVSQEGTN